MRRTIDIVRRWSAGVPPAPIGRLARSLSGGRRAGTPGACGRDARKPESYALRSGAGAGAGGCCTGVETSVDGPLPGAMVIFSPLLSSGSDSFCFM